MFGILSSVCKLEINNVKFFLPKVQGNITNDDYGIRLKIYFYGIIKIFDKDITDIKIKGKKLKDKIRNAEINLEKDSLNLDLRLFKELKNLRVKLENLDLRIVIGTENAAVTAIIVGIVWGVLANLFKNKIRESSESNYFVEPVYMEKNLLKINLDGIFKFKMRNIIIMMIKIIMMRRVKKDGRTSDRRSYVYSNE